jgi:cytochrome bd-type quinol oxidase subunit 2
MTARRRSWASDRLALAGALVLLGASIVLYPGGTFLDESTRGYSFAHNFLSDLGSTVALNYQRNWAGAILFGLAIVLGVFTLGACIVATVRVLSVATAARFLARLAAAGAVLVCVGYLGVAVTPEDRSMGLHLAFGMVAFRTFPVVTTLLALATMRDDRFRARAATGWIVLTLVLAGFIAVGHLGPSVRTEHGLTVQVLTQKTMALAVIVVLWLESHETEFASTREVAVRDAVGSTSPTVAGSG